MKEDYFTREQQKLLLGFAKELQATICVVANKRAGVNINGPDFRVRGIYKAEGGVTVNDRDIVCGPHFCYDDFHGTGPEPGIVDEVIIDLAKKIDWTKDIGEELRNYCLSETGLDKLKVEVLINQLKSNPFSGNKLYYLLGGF